MGICRICGAKMGDDWASRSLHAKWHIMSQTVVAGMYVPNTCPVDGMPISISHAGADGSSSVQWACGHVVNLNAEEASSLRR